MLVLAHVGHWWQIVLYFVPVALLAGGLLIAGRHLPETDDGEWRDDEEPGR
ncbi:hypothetical protein SK069_17045 [Patulibacter brassicae]|uniref:Uncharacterized protein n=1 Tax=Patulibacter brassicae TaxID=1705717 RepID=A0ABU4VNA5_9ACTN|nr:hypothetical protein [Patulibacter brassicae]MDX8153308.1 hypothetical protein [Patulibacter brassicae]